MKESQQERQAESKEEWEYVFFLEEQSMRAFLSEFLSRLHPDLIFTYIVFEGKSDLEKKIERRLKHWLKPNVSFFILRDLDRASCEDIKNRLLNKCKNAKKESEVIIVCRELESWFLGNLATVSTVYNIKHLEKKQNHKKFQNPDRLEDPCKELLKLTNNRYQKIDGSRRIGKKMDPQPENCSHSFQHFYRKIEGLSAAKQ